MAHQVAIDRPSHKFVSFLKKYYGLKNAIPQVGQKSVIRIELLPCYPGLKVEMSQLSAHTLVYSGRWSTEIKNL